MTKVSHGVFRDEFDFLAIAFAWLTALVVKLQLKRKLAEIRNDHISGNRYTSTVGKQHQVPQDETERQLAEATEQEASARADLDARLEAHRGHPDARRLALDCLADKHDLDRREQLVLLANLPAAIGHDLAEDVLLDWAPGRYGGGGLAIDALISLMEPEGLRERVAFRDYFSPDSRLVSSGLIVVDHVRGEIAPAEVLDAEVKLSGKAWQALAGQGQAGAEVNPGGLDAG